MFTISFSSRGGIIRFKTYHWIKKCPLDQCEWSPAAMRENDGDIGRDKMDAISQTTFSSAFYWMKMFEFRLKFHRSLFLSVQLTICWHFNNMLALVQTMAWRSPGDKPLSEPMMVSLPTHICVTWPQCVRGHKLVMSRTFWGWKDSV